MNDLETQIRDALRRHENDAPSLDPSDARRAAGRTRRRQVLNVATVGVGTLALVIGLVAGLGGLLRAARSPTVMHRPPSVVSPSPSEAGTSYRLLRGDVTFSAAPPWDVGFAGPWALWLDNHYDERVHVLADPRPIATGCQAGPAPADAQALARSIRSDPDLEATRTAVVDVGGVEALRMDVVATTEASVCPDWEGPGIVREKGPHRPENGDDTVVVGEGNRMRLFLLDLPGGSPHILAIAIVAPETRFEQVVQAAAPIVRSFDFHTGS